MCEGSLKRGVSYDYLMIDCLGVGDWCSGHGQYYTSVGLLDERILVRFLSFIVR